MTQAFLLSVQIMSNRAEFLIRRRQVTMRRIKLRRVGAEKEWAISSKGVLWISHWCVAVFALVDCSFLRHDQVWLLDVVGQLHRSSYWRAQPPDGLYRIVSLITAIVSTPVRTYKVCKHQLIISPERCGVCWGLIAFSERLPADNGHSKDWDADNKLEFPPVANVIRDESHEALTESEKGLNQETNDNPSLGTRYFDRCESIN